MGLEVSLPLHLRSPVSVSMCMYILLPNQYDDRVMSCVVLLSSYLGTYASWLPRSSIQIQGTADEDIDNLEPLSGMAKSERIAERC